MKHKHAGDARTGMRAAEGRQPPLDASANARVLGQRAGQTPRSRGASSLPQPGPRRILAGPVCTQLAAGVSYHVFLPTFSLSRYSLGSVSTWTESRAPAAVFPGTEQRAFPTAGPKSLLTEDATEGLWHLKTKFQDTFYK